MTRDEILAMKPGRELDALISERLFERKIICWEPGWAPDGCWSMDLGAEGEKDPWVLKRCCCDFLAKHDREICAEIGVEYREHYKDKIELRERCGHFPTCLEIVPNYSTTWEGMRLVVEAMRAKGWRLKLLGYVSGSFAARFYGEGGDVRYGESVDGNEAPHAVALAALLAGDGERV